MNLWSLRRLGRLKWLRKLVKAGFRLRFRDGRVYRIRRGPLRGARWCYRERHPFWMPLGQYEKETARWLGRVLEPGHVFFDVGAHAGYFTLLGSRLVGATGRVVAFEPVPYNAAVVEQQMALNGLSNVRLERCALSADTGEARLAVPANLANARLDGLAVTRAHAPAETVITVSTVSLDDYVERSKLRPDVVKIDVEGAEVAVLTGARRLLSERPPVCVVSTHSPELRASCRRVLADLGYRVSSLSGFEHELVAIPGTDPEQAQPGP